MPKTFNCSYCSKEYPHSATLIGKKLRCSGCKNVIQLRADGSVVKIVERKDTEQVANKKTKEQSQPLTKRQKKQVEKTLTRSLERRKSALNAAAQDAIKSFDDTLQNDHKPQQEKSAPATTTIGASSQVDGQKHKVVRSTYAQKHQINSTAIIGVFSLLISIVVLLFYFWEPAKERVALAAFSKTVPSEFSRYPLKLEAYRNRMWLYTRDGVEAPPIVLNAKHAEITFLERAEWSELSRWCNEMLKDMSLVRRFGMWVSSDKQVQVETLWNNYVDKSNLPMFYGLLEEKGIKFMHCEIVPAKMKERGFSEPVIYVASLLLAGTGDKHGRPCRDFGLASDQYAEVMEIYEFNGDKSLTLVEKQNEYEISGGSHYTGLIVGFINTSESESEYRVLDIRFDRTMSDFYKDIYNPLRKLTKSARLRMLNEFVVPLNDTRTENSEGVP